MGDHDETRRRVAILAVHGMGQQKEAETLLEWAEPLARRLEWLAAQSDPTDDNTAVLMAVQGQSPRGVARSPLSFSGVGLLDGEDADGVALDVVYRDWERRPVRLEVRILEARWSEAFLGLSRGDVFTWGMGFVWRTGLRLGAHFTRTIWLAIWRVLELFGFQRDVPRGTRWLRVPGGVALSVVFLGFVVPLVVVLWAFILSIAVALTLLLPVAGLLLFLPPLKDALEGIVDSLVEIVGDVGTWTSRPVRAAAMRDVVRRRLDAARSWVRGEDADSTAVIVVAHSQGSVIAAETLFDTSAGEKGPQVDAFVSVGSAISLLGTSRWDGSRRSLFRRFVAGALDRRPTFEPVTPWAERHPRTQWFNMWGIWDPFASGPISTGPKERAARWRLSYRKLVHRALAQGAPVEGAPTIGPIVTQSTEQAIGTTHVPGASARGPREYAIHNTASPFTDHQSYSSNIVQVVDPIARLAMALDLPISESDVAPSTRASASAEHEGRVRQHVRAVREQGVNQVLTVLLGASIVLTPIPDGFLAAVRTFLTDTFSDPTGFLLSSLVNSGWLPKLALGVGVAALGLWLNSLLWRSYSRRVAWSPPARRYWVAGAVLRVALAGALAFVVWAYWPDPENPWRLAGAVALTLGLSASVVVPTFGLVPLVVKEQR